MQRLANKEEIETFHTREVWKEGTDEVIGYELILDENSEPIPLAICLCFAREPRECVCQCKGWEGYLYFE